MIEENIYRKYLKSLLEGDRNTCRSIVQDLLNNGLDVQKIYLDLLHRSLYEVGDLWELNKVSVATEHIATGITEHILAGIYQNLSIDSKSGNKAIITCSPDEYHQVGGRMVADIFEMNGWETDFLGANTPVAELLSIIEERNPDVVGISVSIFFNMNKCIQTVQEIKGAYPNIDIVLGGQAFRWNNESLNKNLRGSLIYKSVKEAEKDIISGK